MKPGYRMDLSKCPQCGQYTVKGVFEPLMPTRATWINVVTALAREIEWYKEPSRCLYGVLPFIAEVEEFVARAPVKPSTMVYRLIAAVQLARLKKLTQ